MRISQFCRKNGIPNWRFIITYTFAAARFIEPQSHQRQKGSVDSAAALQTEGRAFEPGVVHYICGLLYKFAVFPRIFILQSERSGAAAQGFGEAIPKHTVAPWSAAFGGSPRRLNKPAVYDHSGRKTRHQTKPNHVYFSQWRNSSQKNQFNFNVLHPHQHPLSSLTSSLTSSILLVLLWGLQCLCLEFSCRLKMESDVRLLVDWQTDFTT